MNRVADLQSCRLTPSQQLMRDLHRDDGGRIVFVIADGLGGLPDRRHAQTELEASDTPNLDRLASDNTCGLIDPVLPGITCGSGPGHLALFGYDPLEHRVGRGVLSALGIGFELTHRDIALRGNLARFGDHETVANRRAGPIGSDRGRDLIHKLREIELDDVELFVEHVRDHRFCLILRGDGLHDDVSDTDPQVDGRRCRRSEPASLAARPTAELINQFMDESRQRLAGAEDEDANGVLLRGAGRLVDLPSLKTICGLESAAVALVPMYRGVGRLLGMDVPEPANDLDRQIDTVCDALDEYDFVFLHHKTPDKTGEAGDFEGRMEAIEQLDRCLPRLIGQDPDVLVVTGDHSTPARLHTHSWHPVPVLLAAEHCRPDPAASFGETECLRGGLGRFEARHLMTLALAHAGRLDKFGA